MSTTSQMIEYHPRPINVDHNELVKCIQECMQCAQTCTACADACLSESDVQEMAYCIRTDMDCADICEATGRMLSRQTKPDIAIFTAQLKACEKACAACGAECRRHSDHHEHCRVCGEQCQRCEEACQGLLSAIGSSGA